MGLATIDFDSKQTESIPQFRIISRIRHKSKPKLYTVAYTQYSTPIYQRGAMLSAVNTRQLIIRSTMQKLYYCHGPVVCNGLPTRSAVSILLATTSIIDWKAKTFIYDDIWNVWTEQIK